MKIAIIMQDYKFHGGAEVFSQNLVKQLAGAGNDVHIYSIEWDAPEIENVKVHRVPVLKVNRCLTDITFAVSSYFLLRNEPFDIIQSHEKTLYQDIYRAGGGCHIEWLKQRWKRNNWRGKLSCILNPSNYCALLLQAVLFRRHRFRKVITNSNFIKKNIMQHYNTDEKDIEVIYNGVDLQKFNPDNKEVFRDKIRKRYSIPADAFVVLFVGSGFERKGVRFLLMAAEMVPENLTVLIVGRDSERKFARLTKNQRVIFCGPQKNVHEYYASSDLFVFPTIYDPFANVTLEALASGLPVITTRLNGAAEIIENGVHGFVVDRPEDVAEMAESISCFMDKRKNHEAGLNARRLAENFSYENYLKNVNRLYNSLISRDLPAVPRKRFLS